MNQCQRNWRFNQQQEQK